MRARAGFVLSACLLAGCASADDRKIEAMVADRMGEVTSMSRPVIYRQDDVKKVCVIVHYNNEWGEPMPPVAVIGWYVFRSETWHTDNPREIDESFDCAQYAAEHGQILEG